MPVCLRVMRRIAVTCNSTFNKNWHLCDVIFIFLYKPHRWYWHMNRQWQLKKKWKNNITIIIHLSNNATYLNHMTCINNKKYIISITGGNIDGVREKQSFVWHCHCYYQHNNVSIKILNMWIVFDGLSNLLNYVQKCQPLLSHFILWLLNYTIPTFSWQSFA